MCVTIKNKSELYYIQANFMCSDLHVLITIVLIIIL